MEPRLYLHWDVSPELIHIGPVTLRWYGLLFALGFLLGIFILRRIYRIEDKPLEDVDRIFHYMAVGTVVGARLGHCLFYDPGYYLTHPLEILMIWHGGLASHGAALGIFLAIYLYCRRRPDQPYLWVMDRIVIPTMLAGSLIRIGNLFNSEILGIPATVPWAIVFVRVDPLPRHPVQLYEAMAYAVIFGVLVAIYRYRRRKVANGFILGTFLLLTFGVRFMLEFFKTRQAVFGHDLPLSVGQWLSIPMVILGLWLMIRNRRTGSGDPAPS